MRYFLLHDRPAFQQLSAWRKMTMKISRRESMQLSAGALASFSGLAVSQAAAQTAPAGLAETQLRNISSLPLKPDGSAPEYTPQEAGTITGGPWRTKNPTPEI